MGAGYPDRAKWSERYLYTHAEAYLAIKDRVELVGFVEPDIARAQYAHATFGGASYKDVEPAIRDLKPDIVSICTPPETHFEMLSSCYGNGVRGYWCEKPLGGIPDGMFGAKVQVNYIRRFENRHVWFRPNPDHAVTSLWVWAKKDVHTVCHFTDLARFWGVEKAGLHYFHMDGPCSYVAHVEHAVRPDYDTLFPLGGIPDGSPFMVNALTNLLDAVEGKAELISPPENAIESEKWANEILEAKCP